MLRALLVAVIALPLGLMLAPVWTSAPTSLSQRRFAAMCLAIGLASVLVLSIEHGQTLQPKGELAVTVRAGLGTWVGQVFALQAMLIAAAAVPLLHARHARLAVVPLAAALLCIALGGHAVSGAERADLSIASIVHVMLAGLWFGALPMLWLAARAQPIDRWRALLARFSRFALPGMVVIVASGLWLADWSVQRGSALVATTYGQVLLVKLALVAAALCCAWQLRRWLSRPQGKAGARVPRWLAREGLIAGGVVLAAGTIAGQVPAAHDRIDQWPYAFRLAPEVVWKQGEAAKRAAMVIGAVLPGAGLIAAWCWRRRPWRAAALMGGSLAAGAAVGLPAITVEAYPSTYAAAQAGYEASSINVGAQLYARHCVSCHGVQGLGDGPLARPLSPPPANLTEPHVGWHTHGDLYWWLTHGFPRSAMPGFSAQTTEVERWHLINHLTALALGHEARTLGTRVAARDPWLAAIDFRYPSGDGEFMALSDWRKRSAVLLVLLREPSELRRIDELMAQVPRLGVRLVVVVPPALADAARKAAGVADAHPAEPAPMPVDVVADDEGHIAQAWSNYRRTLANPDFRDADSPASRVEFLIDRFGFVRARWRADETPSAPDETGLLSMLRALAAEPDLKAPDVHAH